MKHPFSPIRIVFTKSSATGMDALAQRVSLRLKEIKVGDHILVHYHSQRSVPHPYGIYVAIRQYSPAELIKILHDQDALDDSEDLKYFKGQIPDEDELTAMLEEDVLTLLTDEIEESDLYLEASSPEHFGHAISRGEWQVTKVARAGAYGDRALADSEIVTELALRPDY